MFIEIKTSSERQTTIKPTKFISKIGKDEVLTRNFLTLDIETRTNIPIDPTVPVVPIIPNPQVASSSNGSGSPEYYTFSTTQFIPTGPINHDPALVAAYDNTKVAAKDIGVLPKQWIELMFSILIQ